MTFLLEKSTILKNFKDKTNKGYILFQTGYGPSGLPHIGTFAEVSRTQMVMKMLNKISDIPTKLFTFSDDYDALRKVPENIPNQKMLQENLGKPLTSIPDPFEKYKSFAEHNNKKLKYFEIDFFNRNSYHFKNIFVKTVLEIKLNFKITRKPPKFRLRRARCFLKK